VTSADLHARSEDERAELLARHALGLADPSERRAIEQHLGDGCTGCAAVLQAAEAVGTELALAPRPVPVSDALRRRVLAAVDEAASAPARGFHFVAADEGEWRAAAPGVWRRRLGRDPDSRSASYLVRVAAGASVPPHAHTAAEHCLVIEGDFIVDGRILGPGDYHRADAGTTHRSLRSVHGCIFLVVEAAPAEPIAR
jgi:anti-sigma factor ChrR (cupin superfamily)